MGLYTQKIFSGTSNILLAKEIARLANNKLGELSIEKFSDGELWVKYGENLRGNDVYIVQSTNPPGDYQQTPTSTNSRKAKTSSS